MLYKLVCLHIYSALHSLCSDTRVMSESRLSLFQTEQISSKRKKTGNKDENLTRKLIHSLYLSLLSYEMGL